MILFEAEKTGWSALLAPQHDQPVSSQTVRGKRVLITGAGGSIGAALAHAVNVSSPASLIFLDTSEHSLYEIDRDLPGNVPVLGSVTDRTLLTALFEEHRPQIIFHAAAFKHVPLMERHPFAAIINNAGGTLALAEIAAASAAEHLVLVSTDKAADPTSIMGAAKRLAELVILSLGARTATRMSAVRLGNVLGSQGSVLPLFLHQLQKGGPLTVTHPDASRYFLTVGETLEALFAAVGLSTNPAIAVPSLSPPLLILDLAHHLLNLHNSQAPIHFNGLRPGDKLTETLLARNEYLIEQTGPLRIIESPVPPAFPETFRIILNAAEARDLPGMLEAIATLVPEYQPSPIITATLRTSVTT